MDYTVKALFEARLRKANLRLTHVRRQIFAVLAETTKPLSVQEIIDCIDGVHFVSVYRSVDALLEAKLIKQVPQGFKNKYELSDDFKPHHHHAICERCGSSISIRSPQVEKLMKRVTVAAGLKPTKHHFETYGICQRCQSKQP